MIYTDLFIIIIAISFSYIVNNYLDKNTFYNLSASSIDSNPYSLLLPEQALVYINKTYSNNKQRDMDVVNNPLAPPEQRHQQSRVPIIFNNQPINIPILSHNEPNNGQVAVRLNEYTRGEPDNYQQLGVLYKVDGKAYQLFGRHTYPGSWEWEYYVLGKDNGGMNMKHKLDTKKEIYTGDKVNVPFSSGEFTAEIYDLAEDQYRYIPL
jgi:hypothetical protein